MGEIAYAQAAPPPQDTGDKVTVRILSATYLNYIVSDSGNMNQLIGDVQLQQGDNILYCDSAYLNLSSNNVEAFGNVRIVQTGGTEASSDYLRYRGNQKLAYMRGNVNLTDGKDNLWSEEVNYDVSSKIGTYSQGGTLQSGTTTLSSNAGTYNMRNKDARFVGQVYATDPQYDIVSEDLGYNTNTKIVQFFSPSTVTSETSILQTSSGTYDTKKEIAHFTSRSSVLNKEQYIEADKLDYNKTTGYGNAVGNVIAIDTQQRTTLYCGQAFYNEKKRTLLAIIKPVMKQLNGDDSLFIRADTFYSAPIPRPEDTMTFEKTVGKGRNKKTIRVPVSDTVTVVSSEDSSAPRYFTGYHHVSIFSDSLQGRCDSISYSDKDSVLRMMYDPVAWSRNSQITGDTILLYMDSGKLRKLYVPNNGFIVSQSGPDKAQMYDQVQGKTITGYFVNNNIDHMVVKPAAETIYYSKDDNNAYLGVMEAQSERMRILFKDQEINKIVMEQNTKQKLTPMQDANIPGLRLSRFSWQAGKRPKSREELFR